MGRPMVILRLLLLLLKLSLVAAQVEDSCDEDNGGCEHFCHNTDISYYCTCDTGYRVIDDLHSCLWLNCESPGDLEDGWMNSTDNYNTESYVQFGCNDSSSHTLLGNELRRCDDMGEWVEWSGEQPVCRDECTVGVLNEFCAAGVPSSQCLELGCCTSDTGLYCLTKKIWSYLRYHGRRPTENNGNGWGQVDHGTPKGCQMQCSMADSPECQAFGMHDRGYEQQPNETVVKLDDCHFFDQTKQWYEDRGLLGEDETFDFYDQIQTHRMTEDLPNEDYHNLESLYVGCYSDVWDDRDLEHLMWLNNNMSTTSRCINDCRSGGYRFAGLQYGTECRCGNGLIRRHGDQGADCDMECTGDTLQVCGGSNANSVYRVPVDARHIGCYSYEDFPLMLWDNDADRSAVDCVEGCQAAAYQYAALHNGGACYCKDSYGEGGPAGGDTCNLQCGTQHWGEQNCGGTLEYAFYDTKLAFEITASDVHTAVSTFYHDDQEMNGITAMVFTYYKRLKSIITPRIVIHASEVVQTPGQALPCSQDCYEPCGAIYHPEGLGEREGDLYLHFFHINLADIAQYTNASTQRVFVYAQTTVIDRDVHLSSSLLVRTRQLVIDRNDDPWIYVDANKPPIYNDLDEVMTFGPEPDMTFIKQSEMCARLLLDTQQLDDANVAWSMLHDIGHEHAFTDEHEAYSQAVRMTSADGTGLGRADAQFAPFFTQEYIEEILALYSDRVTPYLAEYDVINDDATSDEDFASSVESMLQHHIASSLNEAVRSFNGIAAGVLRSDATYRGIQDRYEQSLTELDEATVGFEDGINDVGDVTWQDALLELTGGVQSMVHGLVRELDAEHVESELDELIEGVQGLADVMQNLADCVEKTHRLMLALTDIVNDLEDLDADVDYSKYMGDVEFAVAFSHNLERWVTMKSLTHVIMSDPYVAAISGSQAYYSALLDICNWGEASARSGLELGQSLSEAFRRKKHTQGKQALVARYDGYMDELNADLGLRPLMLASMKELEYELRLDMNKVLFTYCQLYYYMNLVDCNYLLEPDYAASLDTLLTKFNVALQNDIWAGPDNPVPVSVAIRVLDEDTSPDCVDAKLCPINYLRNNRVFFYEIDVGREELARYDQLRITEVSVRFEGATSTGTNRYLRLQIESSGPLARSRQGSSYEFVTCATTLTHEYHIGTNFISIRALPYYPYGDIIQHVTPYTIWIISVNEAISQDIDLSDVTSVDFQLDGTAVIN